MSTYLSVYITAGQRQPRGWRIDWFTISSLIHRWLPIYLYMLLQVKDSLEAGLETAQNLTAVSGAISGALGTIGGTAFTDADGRSPVFSSLAW